MKQIVMYAIIALLCLAMAAGVFLGGPPPSNQRGGGAPGAEPAIAELNADDTGKLDRQREVAESLWVKTGGEPASLETAAGKVAAVKAVMEKAEGKNSVWELQCLGVMFGDALVQDIGLKWVVASDGSRRRPGLVVPKSDGILLPIGIFVSAQKSGQAVDPVALFESVKQEVAGVKSGKTPGE